MFAYKAVILSTLLVTLAAATPASTDDQCQEGEVYNQCGSACPTTCDNKDVSGRLCTQQCVSGCFCAKGTVRAPNGTCVPPKQCPATRCPKGEIYTECGTACPTTCENKDQTDRVCTDQCVQGCVCANNTIQASDGTCVPPEQCPPPKCPDGEIYTECGSACPTTCENKDQTDRACTAQCVQGCVCGNNTIRSSNGTCVQPTQCPPPKCPEGEIYTECGTACATTCENKDQTDRVCTDQCVQGCVCANNTIRAPDGTCVPPNQCPPPKCPKGEVYTECGSSCPTTCESRGDTCKICTAQCVPGCFCAEGTIRAPNGSCVPPKKCPPRTCSGANEVFDECPPTCPKTQNCSNLWSKIPCTPIDCCSPQCRCKSGFYRNGDNKCISGKKCK